VGLTEKLSLLIGTVGADGAVRDFNRIGLASKKLGTDAQATGGKFDKLASGLGVSASTMKAGLVTGAAVAGTALIAFGKSAVDAASNLAEVQSKSNQVFGFSADLISDWAQGAADSFGLSERAALEAASGFGNMFNQLGVGVDEAAAMSTGIVELAADFASFHNADISDVLTAQSAAFRGEYDSLQRFLPLINAATVEQRALEMTGKQTTKALTAQEKALAVNTLMFEGAGKAAGDFDRTSGSLANQQRILAANIEEASATIGQVLIPAVSGIIDLFNDTIGLVEALGGGFVDLVDDVNKFSGATDDADKKSTGLGDTLNAFYNEVLRGRPAVDDAAESVTALGLSIAETNAGMDEYLNAEWGEGSGAFDELVKTTLAATSAQRGLEQAGRSLEAAQRSEADAVDELNKLLKQGAVDVEAVRDAEKSLASVRRATGKATRDQAKAQAEYDQALAKATDLQGSANAQAELADAADNLADANDSVAAAQERETDAAEALRKAQAGDPEFQDKIADARQRVKDATQGVADASYSVASAAYAANQATEAQNVSLLTNAGSIGTVRGEWEKLLALNPQIAAFLNPALGTLPVTPPTPTEFVDPRFIGPLSGNQRYGGSQEVPADFMGPLSANQRYGSSAGATKNVTVNVAQTDADPAKIAREVSWAVN
jgi:hypothetical protein